MTAVPGPVGTESGLRLVTEPGFGTMVEFAVATLDDGSEVRMRCLGNRVEVRTWDKTASCNPPPLAVDQVGAHVVDARPALAAAVPAPAPESGWSRLAAEDGWDDVDAALLLARAVEGVAWGLLDQTMDVADRDPGDDLLAEATATARKLLTAVPAPVGEGDGREAAAEAIEEACMHPAVMPNGSKRWLGGYCEQCAAYAELARGTKP